MSHAPTLPASTPGPSITPSPVVESWQEVDSLIQRMQSAVREYANDLTAYVSAQEQAQAEAAEHIRRQLLDDLRGQREQIEKAQNQVAADRNQLQAQHKELDERAGELDKLHRDLDDRESRLDIQANRLEQATAGVARQQSELEAQLRQLQTDRAALTQAQAELDQHKQQLAQRQAELEKHESQIKAAVDALGQREAQVARKEKEFKETAERVTREMREKKQQQDAAMDQRDGTLARRERKCRKTEDELTQRRAKLHQYKEILEKRSQQLKSDETELEPKRRAAEAVLAKRDQVAEAQQTLAQTEMRMIRRWGTHRAITIGAAAMVLVGINAAISYVAAGWLADRTWAATAVVQLPLPAGTPADAWVNSQSQTLASPAMIDRAILTMRQIGYTGSATPDQVRQTLAQGLNVHSPSAGVLLIELHGQKQSELAPILGGLSRALTTEPNSGTNLPGASVVQGATLAAQPLSDNRLTRAAQLMGLLLLVSTVLCLIVTKLLLRRAQPQAVGLNTIAADAQIWFEHAKHLRHNPSQSDDIAPAPIAAATPAPTPTKPDKPRKEKSSRKDKNRSPSANGKNVIDTDQPADENAETTAGGHNALDFSRQPPRQSPRPTADEGDAPEFKPL